MVTLSPFPIFGFEWDQRTDVALKQSPNPHNDQEVLTDNFVRLRNIGKPLSSLPGIHVIAGLALIIAGIFWKLDLEKDCREIERETVNNLIIRGVATMIVGPLVLIVDAIQTLRDRAIVHAYRKGCER